MDLPSLALILRAAALSPIPDERKASEQQLNQLQHTPQHLVRLLQIAVDGNCDMAVRQIASIQFKLFIAKNWSPGDSGEQQKILQSDKELVRDNILAYISQVPTLLRSQLGECLKTIIYADYPEQWPRLLDWVKYNLQNQQLYGALFVLRILSRKYEYKSDEERTPVSRIVEGTFPQLLTIFNGLIQIPNPSLEIAELMKLICKIFWSSIYLELPRQLFDLNVFNAWMILFLTVSERSVPVEGQPMDPELRKSWGWWKVKKWTVLILNRLYSRFGDPKLQSPENKPFALMFQKNYAGRILEGHLNILNTIRVGGYLPGRITNLLLQYLSNSILKNSMYNLLLPRLDVLLFEIVFPLMCFNDNDQKLWEEDPHEYVRKGYNIIEDLYSPRTAAMDFVLCHVLPSLVKLRKEGLDGQEKIKSYIWWLSFLFAIVEALVVAYTSLQYSVFAAVSPVKHVMMTASLLVCGAMTMTWLCDTISESGFGHGSSLIICVGILTGYTETLHKMLNQISGSFSNWLPYLLRLLGIFTIVTMFAVVVTEGCRKIKLQYYGFKLASASREGSPITEVEPYIPFNINPAGMQPVLTTTYLLAFPSILASITGSPFLVNIKEILNPENMIGASPWVYYSIYAFFVFLFNIFDIANLPKEIADYLNKMGARIPNIKPGRDTIEYLTKIQASTRFWGGLLLSFLATSSTVLDHYLRSINQGFSFGFTSVLIIVGSIIELKRSYHAYNVMPSLSKALKRYGV